MTVFIISVELKFVLSRIVELMAQYIMYYKQRRFDNL